MSNAYQCDSLNCKKFLSGEPKRIEVNDELYDICEECMKKIIALFIKPEKPSEEVLPTSSEPQSQPPQVS